MYSVSWMMFEHINDLFLFTKTRWSTSLQEPPLQTSDYRFLNKLNCSMGSHDYQEAQT